MARHFYTKVAFAKPYDRKPRITVPDLLNDRVVPFFNGHEVKRLGLLAERGSKYSGNPERREYYLTVEHEHHAPVSHNCDFRSIDDLPLRSLGRSSWLPV